MSNSAASWVSMVYIRQHLFSMSTFTRFNDFVFVFISTEAKKKIFHHPTIYRSHRYVVYLYTHNMDGVFLIRNGLWTNKYCQKKNQYDTPAKTTNNNEINFYPTISQQFANIRKKNQCVVWNSTIRTMKYSQQRQTMKCNQHTTIKMPLFYSIKLIFVWNCITFDVDLKSNEEKPHKTCYMNNLFAF